MRATKSALWGILGLSALGSLSHATEEDPVGLQDPNGSTSEVTPGIEASLGSAGGVNGAYSDQISFAAAPFYGVTPTLGLSYSSLGYKGGGIAGVGWDLTGASVLRRVGPKKQAATWSNLDRYMLGGSEIVPCPGSAGASCQAGGTGVAWTSKVEDFQRVRKVPGGSQVVNTGPDLTSFTPYEYTSPTNNGIYDIIPGDFKGTGRPDLYMAAFPGRTEADQILSPTFNASGNVTGTTVLWTGPATWADLYERIFGDFNDDGLTDLYLRSKVKTAAPGSCVASDYDKLYLANSNGTGLAATAAWTATTCENQGYAVQAYDAANDGRVDLLKISNTEVRFFETVDAGGGAVNLVDRWYLPVDYSAFESYLTDFDGDGIMDWYLHATAANPTQYDWVAFGVIQAGGWTFNEWRGLPLNWPIPPSRRASRFRPTSS